MFLFLVSTFMAYAPDPVKAAGEVALTVQIVDEKGAPLAGANVVISPADLSGKLEDVTDGNGKFIFLVDPTVTYTITQKPIDSTYMPVISQTYKAPVGATSDTLIFNNKKIVVVPKVFKVTLLDKATNAPISGTPLELQVPGAFGLPPITAITDAQGVATFNNLPSGQYSLGLSATWGSLPPNYSPNPVNISVTDTGYLLWM